MINKLLEKNIFRKNRQILLILLLLSLVGYITSSYAAPFTTVKTVNTIMGEAPTLANTVNSQRIGLFVNSKVYQPSNGRIDFALADNELYNYQFAPLLWPAITRADYNDSDGDESEIVVAVQSLRWYRKIANTNAYYPDPITVDNSEPVLDQLYPVAPSAASDYYKLTVTVKVQAKSTYGDPKAGAEITLSRDFFIKFTDAHKPNGSFGRPAVSCLQIKNNKPTAADGEYWIGYYSGDRIADRNKTFCDMTNGGYTLVWSYSELTAQDIYTAGGWPGLNIYNSGYQVLSNNRPANLVTVKNGSINYTNHRLTQATMKNIPVNKANQYAAYRVRIAYDPKNMNDPWGNENYLNSEFTKSGYDFLFSTEGGIDNAVNYPTSVGKIFGLSLSHSPAGVVYAGSRISSAKVHVADGWGAHWDIGNKLPNRVVQGKFPTPSGQAVYANFDMNLINNLFGHHGEREVNHLFGKCGGPAGGDYNYDYTTTNIKSCEPATKVPHSFNSGQGRYLQWFVK